MNQKPKIKRLLSLVLCLSVACTSMLSLGAAPAAAEEEAAPTVETAGGTTVKTDWRSSDWQVVSAIAPEIGQVVSTGDPYLHLQATSKNDNAANQATALSEQAGDIKNGVIKVTISPNQSRGDTRFTIPFRYHSGNDTAWVGYNSGGWYLQWKNPTTGNGYTSGKAANTMPEIGEETDVVITFQDTLVSLTVGGQEIYKDAAIPKATAETTNAGKIGFMCGQYGGAATEMYMSNIQIINNDDPTALEGYDWTEDTWNLVSNGGVSEIVLRGADSWYDLQASAGNNSVVNAAVVTSTKADNVMKNGSIKATFTPQTDAKSTSFAIVFRYTDINNCAWLGYDAQGWYWQQRVGGAGNYYKGARVPGPNAGEATNLQVDFEDNKLSASVNGEVIFDSVEMPAGFDTLQAGQVGFLARAGSHVLVNGFEAAKWDVNAPDYTPTDPANVVELKSSVMTVAIDKTFPRVIKYTLDGDVMNGQPNVLNTIKINGVSVTPASVSFEAKSGDTAVYTVTVQDSSNADNVIDADLEFTLKVEENILSYDITKVTNRSAKKLNTIDIPNLSLISVTNQQANATFDGAQMKTGANQKGDSSIAVTKGFIPGTKAYDDTDGYMYAFVSNDTFSAGLWSNSEAGNDKRVARVSGVAKDEAGKSYAFLGLGSGVYTYQNEQMPTPQNTLPQMKVIITRDENKNGQINWQDGAVAYRKIMNNPFKSEEVPELVNQRVVENFASQGAHPFLETLDGVKRVALATDGLGQHVLLKGYANEGHDSAHPDYGDIGQRIGGAEDMITLMEQGEQYGAKFGIHINATEAYPEAKSFSNELMSGGFGWNWLDESWYIDHMLDLSSGLRADRLDDLYYALGGENNKLDFIYLDVWSYDSWPTRQIANQFIERGWRCANEWGYANEYESTWNHWATDLSYGKGAGINSDIARFIRNHQKDSWEAYYPSAKGTCEGPLLGGMDVSGFEGWQKEKDFNEYTNVTFNTNIPTKFLQHYLVNSWENDPTIDTTQRNAEVKIELINDEGDTVVTQRKENSRGREIFLNGVKILDGEYVNNVEKNVYLIPWFWDAEGGKLDEAKLYHWNYDGGMSTWQLPEGWAGAKVYKLTDTGREEIADIASVNDGKITINAEPMQGYVLYQSEQKNPSFEEMGWGYGTHLIDPNFTSQSLAPWTVTGDAGAVKIVRKSDNFNPVLQIGDTKAETAVSQQLTGLKGGKQYAALVAVDNRSDARAYLEVTTTDGKKSSNYVEVSQLKNYIGVNAHNTANADSRMQNLYVWFTVPEGATTATLTMKCLAGTGVTQFDEIRVVENASKNQTDALTFMQDFESNVQGLYPFAAGNYNGGPADVRVHLSEKHAPYTQVGWRDRLIDDVLDGDWSVKIHQQIGHNRLVMQTIPQNFRFEPGVEYTVEFEYEAGTDDVYGVLIGEGEYISGVPEGAQLHLLKAANTPTKVSFTFTGAESGNTWIGIYSPAATENNENYITVSGHQISKKDVDSYHSPWKMGIASLVLDNLKITQNELNTRYLDEILAKAEGLQENAYTPSSWKTLQAAVTAGKALQGSTDKNDQQKVNDAVSAIDAAIGALRGVADTTALRAVIAQSETLQEADYTPSTWTGLQDALTAAKALTAEATQAEVDAAAAALRAAIDALTGRADRTALDAAMVKANALQKDDYTGETWAAVESALTAANALTAEATQDEVDAAAKALNAAIDALEKATPPEAPDRDKLDAAIKAAEAIKDASKYTTDSWKALQDALTTAKALSESATQAEIDQAERAITAAIDGLKLVESSSSTPSNPDSSTPSGGASSDGNGGSNTGDNGLLLPVGLLGLAALGGILLAIKRKKIQL